MSVQIGIGQTMQGVLESVLFIVPQTLMLKEDVDKRKENNNYFSLTVLSAKTEQP